MTTHLARAVWWTTDEPEDSLQVTTWCEAPMPFLTDIVFEAALSDCAECVRLRSLALNAVRPKAPEFDEAFHEAVNKKLGED